MLVYVRRNAQHLELKLLESTQFALNTVVIVYVSARGSTGCLVSPPPLPPQNIQSHEKSHTNHRVRGEASTTSLALGTNPEGRERVNVKASRIQSIRIESALVCVRRNVQHRELKLPEFTWFMLVAVVMAAVFTGEPIGCLVSPPPLESQNVQSHKKAPASHRARGETPTISFELGANREGKERVEGKTSRIQSSRIGSVLVYVRRNAQPRERNLLESTRLVLSTVVMIVCVYVCVFIKLYITAQSGLVILVILCHSH